MSVASRAASTKNAARTPWICLRSCSRAAADCSNWRVQSRTQRPLRLSSVHTWFSFVLHSKKTLFPCRLLFSPIFKFVRDWSIAKSSAHRLRIALFFVHSDMSSRPNRSDHRRVRMPRLSCLTAHTVSIGQISLVSPVHPRYSHLLTALAKVSPHMCVFGPLLTHVVCGREALTTRVEETRPVLEFSALSSPS